MEFTRELREILSQIPEGCVATYGEVARALGDVRASKAVFDFLSRNRQESFRVVNSQGETRRWQIEALSKEGIPVREGLVLNLDQVLYNDFETDFPLRRLRNEQEKIAREVVPEDGFESIKHVCGFDVAYDNDLAKCAYAVVDAERLDVTDKGVLEARVDFPYIPSYLAYREYPAIKAASERVRVGADILLIDGHGLSHPRRAGIACHVGVKLKRPTIGVAKSLLVGSVEREPSKVGDFERVLDAGDMIGYALRSSTSRRPIYVSPGHLVSFESSVQIVKGLCKTRLPEPLREAHRTASLERQG
ncbi:MAG: endonuclease V [Thermoplasmata archaeon]